MRGGAPGTRRPALAAAGFLALLAGVGWLGLRIAPSPPPRHAERTPELETVALPPDLPEPVRGYYLATVGEEPPRIKTAVVWGRGYFNLNGLWFPARFKTYFDIPGRAFRRDLDLAWFGIQVFRGSDVYVGGKGELEISGLLGLVEVAYEGEKIDQGDNLAMWGELLGYAPSALLLDPRVRWEPIDARAARLIVPFEDREDSVRVEFAPETGLMTQVSGMRYRNREDTKTPWRGEGSGWKAIHGVVVPFRSEATWEDREAPYVVLDLEGAEYNVDVSEKLYTSGHGW